MGAPAGLGHRGARRRGRPGSTSRPRRSPTTIRDSIIGSVLTLVEDLLGRELALADSPVLDAVRRALTLCPADAPASCWLHPDDLAEVPAESLAELPDSVQVVGDAAVERAGAVAETGVRRIDAQFVTALERVQAVLTA